MLRITANRLRLLIIVCKFTYISLLFLQPWSDAHGTEHTPAATVIEVRGHVEWTSRDTIDALKKDQNVFFGDAILTLTDSRAAILFADGTQTKINGDTFLTIDAPEDCKKDGKSPMLYLAHGEAWARFKGPPKNIIFKTPTAQIGIRGTDWFVKVSKSSNITSVAVREGHVLVSNTHGTLEVSSGEIAHVDKKTAPTKIKIVDRFEGTQWVYFIPETLRFFTFRDHDAHRLKKILTQSDNKNTMKNRLDRAEILHDLGRFSESRREFEHVLNENPDNIRAITGSGIIHMHYGEWDVAEKLLTPLEHNKEKNRQPNLLIALGVLAAHKNRLNDAQAIGDKLVADYGSHPTAHAFSMYLAILTGKTDDAIRLGYDALERFPHDPRIATLLRDALIVSNDVAVDLLTAQTLLHNPNSSLAHLDRGFFLHHIKGVDQPALDNYNKARAHAPENPMIAIETGELLRRMGDYDAALQTFEPLLVSGYRRADLFYRYGLLLSQISDHHGARQMFTKAKKFAGEIESLSGEGIALLRLGKTEEALQALLKATMMSPTIAENYIHLAIARYQLGHTKEALDTLETAAKLDPEDSTPYIIMSMINNDNNEPYKAILVSREAEKRLKFRKKGALDLLEATKNGLANVGASLDKLGLDFWGYSKSLDILLNDPYDPNAHLFPSVIQTNLGNVVAAQSEFIQGAVMDPSVLVEPNRDLTLIKIPAQYTSLAARVGDESGKMGGMAAVKSSGYLQEPYRLDYFLQARKTNQVYWPGDNPAQINITETGMHDGHQLAILLGMHPAYWNDLYLRILSERDDINSSFHSKGVGDPYSVFAPRALTDNGVDIFEFGYHHRFSSTSHLLFKPHYLHTKSVQSYNATHDPFQMYPALINMPRELLPPPLNFMFPNGIQMNPETRVNYKMDVREKGLGIKHFFSVEPHQIAYGLDLIDRTITTDTKAVATQSALAEVSGFSETQLDALGIDDLTLIDDQGNRKQTAFSLYLRDRWRMSDWLLLDAGGSFQYNSINDASNNSIYLSPRVGAAFYPNGQDVFRLGYRENRFPNDLPVTSVRMGAEHVDASDVALRARIGYLESQDVAGLLGYEHGAIGLTPHTQDYRTRWEHVWNDHLFQFAELGKQQIADVGSFNSIWNGINWIADPRVGIQFSHLELFDLEYTTPPFEADLVSRGLTEFKITYVHPENLRLTFWYKLYSKKLGEYPQVGDLEPLHKINAKFTWESDKKDYSFNFFVLNLLNDRDILPGLTIDDRFAFAQIEWRM